MTTLHLVFIGLELDNEETDGECPEIQSCDKCSNVGRNITYDIRKMSYEDYCTKCPEYCVPNIVAAFNCGFHEFHQQPEKETWAKSLPFLTKHTGVPLIFTSYTYTEAGRDLELVQKASSSAQQPLKVEVAKMRNPFRSFRPVRDFEYDNDCDVFYSNQYFSVVRASQ